MEVKARGVGVGGRGGGGRGLGAKREVDLRSRTRGGRLWGNGGNITNAKINSKAIVQRRVLEATCTRGTEQQQITREVQYKRRSFATWDKYKAG